MATVLLVFLSVSATAQLPTYTFQLQARSNFTGAFNLPDGSFFSNVTVRLNDARQVALRLGVMPGGNTQGIWSGGGGAGAVVYESPVGAFLSGNAIGAGGEVVFEQSFSAQDGLYLYDPDTQMTGFLTNLPFGASGWGSPGINSAGEVGYRAGFLGGRAFVSYDGTATVPIHAAEVALDVTSPYSFLFTPSFNDERRIAGKVRLGAAGQLGEERPDHVRIFATDGSSELIAEDRDGDPASPFSSFDNGVDLTDGGRVAFIASLVGGGRGVYLGGGGSDGAVPVEIATEAHPLLSEIEFFAPAANDDGLVAFRAKDAAGLRAVWIGDGTDLARVVGEHDLVPTDLGSARIDQHDTSPVFGGGLDLNAAGDLTFAAGLTPPDNNQVEWGTGAFVALADPGVPPVPIFADGFEGGSTGAWSAVVGGA